MTSKWISENKNSWKPSVMSNQAKSKKKWFTQLMYVSLLFTQMVQLTSIQENRPGFYSQKICEKYYIPASKDLAWMVSFWHSCSTQSCINKSLKSKCILTDSRSVLQSLPSDYAFIITEIDAAEEIRSRWKQGNSALDSITLSNARQWNSRYCQGIFVNATRTAS